MPAEIKRSRVGLVSHVWVEMEAVLQGEVRVPLGGDKVYKDQCVYSFDTPVSECIVCCVQFIMCSPP